MSFWRDLQNNTRDQIAPKIVDTVLTSNIITQIMLGERKSNFTSDVKRIVVKTEKANNGGSFSGLDRFNTNQVNTTQKMVFSPRSYYQPIVLPGDELSLSKTKDSVRDLQVQKGEEASQEIPQENKGEKLNVKALANWWGLFLYYYDQFKQYKAINFRT